MIYCIKYRQTLGLGILILGRKISLLSTIKMWHLLYKKGSIIDYLHNIGALFVLFHKRIHTFVSDLRQVGGFLRVHQFPPPINLIAYDIAEILLNGGLNTINQPKSNVLELSNSKPFLYLILLFCEDRIVIQNDRVSQNYMCRTETNVCLLLDNDQKPVT